MKKFDDACRYNINVQEYTIEWADEFERERAGIERALSGKLLAIEHVGSTSIQGMIAKPILDIAVLVSSFKVIDETAKAKLASLKYDYVHKPEFPMRLFFRRGALGAGTHHLHIFEDGGLEWNRMIAFRDFLRANPNEHEEYAELKRRLAETSSDRQMYTDGKGSFIVDILKKAKASEA